MDIFRQAQVARQLRHACALAALLMLAACGGGDDLDGAGQGGSGQPPQVVVPEPVVPEPVTPTPVDPAPAPAPGPAPGSLFPQVEATVAARCVACHSVSPTMPGFGSAPRGIRYDSADQIRADALRIYVNVVQLEFMPYGNRTAMTAAERDLVRRWYEGEMK